jgi:hypothetical protein
MPVKILTFAMLVGVCAAFMTTQTATPEFWLALSKMTPADYCLQTAISLPIISLNFSFNWLWNEMVLPQSIS